MREVAGSDGMMREVGRYGDMMEGGSDRNLSNSGVTSP